ncbi:synaptosomal-associated protein 47 [Petromyzon marinus]|uniref:synaptosomal-associated protein 47 n=1 Tax=Petromyzon marinus TaxID=7757 RepID=UPI003F72F0E8
MESPIRTWRGSYYLISNKRWVPGRFCLLPGRLCFYANKDSTMLFSTRLADLCEIKKTTVSLVYSALALTQVGGVACHWLSGLEPSRDAVFNVLEHFWREELLGGGSKASASSTALGQHLVATATGSQRRLEEAAQALHHQGQQLDGIGQNLQKMNADLCIADRLLTQLEGPSFFSRWTKTSEDGSERKQVQKEASAGPGGGHQDAATGLIVRVPVMYSRGRGTEFHHGHLAVLCSALEVQDAAGRQVHIYRRSDVDEIEALSPYEVIVKQRFIGQPDVVFLLLSAKIANTIPVLEQQYREKFSAYPTYPWGPAPTNKRKTSGHKLIQTAGRWLGGLMGGDDDASEAEGKVQVQKGQTVSDAESAQLNQVLTGIKVLALESGAEVERQNELLEDTSSLVDRTTSRINAADRRIKKLL